MFTIFQGVSQDALHYLSHSFLCAILIRVGEAGKWNEIGIQERGNASLSLHAHAKFPDSGTREAVNKLSAVPSVADFIFLAIFPYRCRGNRERSNDGLRAAFYFHFRSPY